MFKPLSMRHITLQMIVEDAPAAALVLAEYGVFDPEKTPEEDLPEFPAEHYRTLVNSAQARLDKILNHYGMLVTVPAAPSRLIQEEELAWLDSWLGELWAQCSGWLEELRRLAEGQKQVDQLMMTLVNFLDLDIDLGRLQRKTHFLDVHAGTVPLANVRRLQEALGLAGYVLSRFLESNGSVYGVVAGPRDAEEDIASVLREAGWHPLHLPPEFRDHPEKVRRKFLERRRRFVKDRQAVQDNMAQSKQRYRNRLIAAAQTLALATPYAELGGALRSRGGLAVLSGWVPKREVARLEKVLRERLHYPLVLTAREPLPGESVPSCMHHHRLLQPFVALVKNYGVPRYGELDPTLLFTLTYIAMFGMMYGDVGHGAVIAAGGLLLRRRLKGFAPLVTAVGMASLGFGFLYGSLFGFEEVIQPLWISPLSDPVLMLTIALYWGVGFILLATALTVYNRIGEGRIVEALCDGKGLAGMVFYLGLLYASQQWFAGWPLGALPILAILLPLGTVLAYRWQESRIPLGERLLVVLIEGFEAIMAYLSGTLSFLRVAAFSLNHVALAIAVLTLAQMMDTAGYWLMIVLGNLFSLALEGAIVAIQVLRLEYYEGFSRFFRGDGREFRPLTLFANGTAKASLQTL